MNLLTVQKLDWDSNFFGFGVGRLSDSFKSIAVLNDALQTAAKKNIRLVYGACHHRDDISHRNALTVGGRFVDAKHAYELDLTKIQPIPINIEVAADDARSHQQLYDLAWQAAEFSRFRIDPEMPEGCWQRMYFLWMQNSITGKLADTIIVVHGNNRIVGMITVSHQKKVGQIGLFAVDHKSRGMGIGRRLLNAAIYKCHIAGCEKLEVITQRNNLAACHSYESLGFELIEEKDFFHFWINQL